jgi:hypothetical protein
MRENVLRAVAAASAADSATSSVDPRTEEEKEYSKQFYGSYSTLCHCKRCNASYYNKEANMALGHPSIVIYRRDKVTGIYQFAAFHYLNTYNNIRYKCITNCCPGLCT